MRGHLFWDFTKEFALRVAAPVCLGAFTSEDACARDAFLAQGEAGSIELGNKVLFSWLVDRRGVFLDALFTCFGDSVLVGCAETLCEKSIGKTRESVLRFTHNQLEREISPHALPRNVKYIVALCLQARDKVCQNIDLPSPEKVSAWNDLSKDAKLVLIHEALKHSILPFLARDGGGVEVLDLVEGNKVIMRFQGACVDCFASSGSTLSSIQQVLTSRVHHSIVVQSSSNLS